MVQLGQTDENEANSSKNEENPSNWSRKIKWCTDMTSCPWKGTEPSLHQGHKCQTNEDVALVFEAEAAL